MTSIDATSFRASSITPPIAGKWSDLSPHLEFTTSVELRGVKFRRCVNCIYIHRPNLAAQYREDVPRNSMHMYVFADGTYRIDHRDEYNPDYGQLIQHGLHDTPLPVFLSVALGLGVIYLLTMEKKS